jgi:hypothetical protein
MPLIKIPFKPGINREIPEYANEGGYDFSNLIRFRMGYAEKLGGWQNTTPDDTFLGVTRSMQNWVSLLGENLLGFGTTQQFVVQDGAGNAYHDITPTAFTATLTGASFSTVAIGSPVIQVNNLVGSIVSLTPNNGLDVGSLVYFYAPNVTGSLLMETSGYLAQETWPGSPTSTSGYRFSIGSAPSLTINGVTLFAEYQQTNVLATAYPVISVDRQYINYASVTATSTTVTFIGTSPGYTPPVGTWVLITGLNVSDYNGTYQVLSSSYDAGTTLTTITYTNSSGIVGSATDGTATWINSFQVIGEGTASAVGAGSSGISVYANYLPNVGNSTTQRLTSGNYSYTKRLWSQASFGDDLIMAIPANPIYYWPKDTTNWTPAITLSDYALTQPYQQTTVTSNSIASTTFNVEFNDYIYPGEVITIASGAGSVPTNTKIVDIVGLQVTVDQPVTVYNGSGITAGTFTSGSGYQAPSYWAPNNVLPHTYTGISLLGGSGAGATADITVGSTGGITNVAITSMGTGYQVGDVLHIDEGGSLATVTVGTGPYSIGAISTFISGTGYPVSSTYTAVPLVNITGNGTGVTATITTNGSGVISAISNFSIGTGYNVGDAFTIYPTGGLVLGTADVSTAGKGVLTGTITGGTGYTNNVYKNVLLTNSAGSGTNARATITVSGGVVTGVAITVAGTGYQVGDLLVAPTGLLGAGSGFVYTVATVSAVGTGSGYTDGVYAGITLNNVTGSGSGAVATITVTSNSVSNVDITTSGSGYQEGDILTATGIGPGTGFTCVVKHVTGLGTGSGFIGKVYLTTMGSGYTPGTYLDIPVVTLTGEGSGAVGSITVLTNGGISSASLGTAYASGSGYNVGDLITFTDSSLGPGTGFVGAINEVYGLGAGTGFTYTITNVAEQTILNLSYSGAYVPKRTNKVFISNIYQFVIALGSNPYDPSNENSTFNPLLIRWSDQANPAQWIPMSSNQAGEQSLGNGSTLVTIVPNLQVLLVFTDTALYQMQYIGAPYVFSFTLLQENISIISQNAAITANNITWWMGTDKFYVYSGTVQALPCPLRRYIFSNINKEQAWQTVVGYNEGFSEIWWFYPSATSTINDSYVKYNFADQVWDYGSLNRTAWNGNAIQDYPLAAYSVQNTYLTADITSTATTIPVADTSSYHTEGILQIGTENIPYTGKTATSFTGCTRTSGVSHTAYSPVKLMIPNQIMYHEYGVDDNSIPNITIPIQSYIQSSDVGLAEGNDLFVVNRIIPDLTFTNSTGATPVLTTTVYPRLNPGSDYQMPPAIGVGQPTITATQLPPPEPLAFPPEQYAGQPVSRSKITAGDGQIYTRVRGRTIAVRYDTGDLSNYVTISGYPIQVPANALGNMWQLGLMRFDVRKDGRR